MSDVATRYFPKDKAASFSLKEGDLLVERSGGGPEQPVGRIGFIENRYARRHGLEFCSGAQARPG